MKRPDRPSGLTVAVVLISAAVGFPNAGAADAIPADSGGILSSGRMFSEKTGESLYANVCQGCHMVDGRGAGGAGSYPSLAGDSNLGAAAYTVSVVVDGRRGMPAFGHAMTDEQVMAVVDFVRTHFGNHDDAPVTADEVRAARREGAAP